MKETSPRAAPKAHAAAPAFGTYNDLLIAVRAENVQKAENFANMEINKITNWAKENRIIFNEQKSKVMLATRRKRREIT